jgi:hypothetical protein
MIGLHQPRLHPFHLIRTNISYKIAEMVNLTVTMIIQLQVVHLVHVNPQRTCQVADFSQESVTHLVQPEDVMTVDPYFFIIALPSP